MLRALLVVFGLALLAPGVAALGYLALFSIGAAGADLGRDDRAFAFGLVALGLIFGAGGALMLRDALRAGRRRRGA